MQKKKKRLGMIRRKLRQRRLLKKMNLKKRRDLDSTSLTCSSPDHDQSIRYLFSCLMKHHLFLFFSVFWVDHLAKSDLKKRKKNFYIFNFITFRSFSILLNNANSLHQLKLYVHLLPFGLTYFIATSILDISNASCKLRSSSIAI